MDGISLNSDNSIMVLRGYGYIGTLGIYKNLVLMKIRKMDAIESLVQTDPTIQWIVINDEMIKNIAFKTKGRKGNDRTALV